MLTYPNAEKKTISKASNTKNKNLFFQITEKDWVSEEKRMFFMMIANYFLS
jgi:hypothetical protein